MADLNLHNPIISLSPFPAPNPLTHIASGFAQGLVLDLHPKSFVVAWDNYDFLSLEESFSSLNVNSLEIQKRNDEIKSAIDSESVEFRNGRKKVVLKS